MSRKEVKVKLTGWLSRQRNGMYMLTQHKPTLEYVGSADYQDFYVKPGDGIGFRHICPWAAELLWEVNLEPLESVRVLTGGTAI